MTQNETNFEGMQLSRGWGAWFLTSPTLGAVMNWTAMLNKPQKQDWRSTTYDMARDLCTVPQQKNYTKAPFGTVPGKCSFNPL